MSVPGSSYTRLVNTSNTPSTPTVDLRSDTVTRPTPAMMQAMLAAELGDDVLGDDPTVKRLEARVAELLGMEAALFTPSGTMANQLAIRTVCEPGDEILCHRDSHILHYETGGPAALSGCIVTTLDGGGDLPRGVFGGELVEQSVRPLDQHDPVTRMVVVENTVNRAGGVPWSLEAFGDVAAAARRPTCLMAPPNIFRNRLARAMKAADPASADPTGAPRPFEKQTEQLSASARNSLGA